MDILKILEESGKDLYPEDLDFFETELATGGRYNAAYQKAKKEDKDIDFTAYEYPYSLKK